MNREEKTSYQIVPGVIEGMVKIAYTLWPAYGDFYDEFRWYIYRGFDLNVATVSGRVAGFILYKLFGKGANIGWFAVSPEFQGKGIGTALLNDMEKRMREQGAEFFFVDSDRKSNWQFYLRRGYEEIAEIYLPGEGNTYLFVKWVNRKDLNALKAVIRPWLKTVYQKIDEKIIEDVIRAIDSSQATPSQRRR